MPATAAQKVRQSMMMEYGTAILVIMIYARNVSNDRYEVLM